jgi:hypothetical protein
MSACEVSLVNAVLDIFGDLRPGVDDQQVEGAAILHGQVRVPVDLNQLTWLRKRDIRTRTDIVKWAYDRLPNSAAFQGRWDVLRIAHV